MKKELQDKLYESYPKIFRRKDLSMKETCMYWGIDCGDGWFNIINKLCDRLQEDIDLNNKPQIEATQVKEKFGTLRFYTDISDEVANELIQIAEKMSKTTCEECGSTDSAENRETNAWWRTRCLKCKDIK